MSEKQTEENTVVATDEATAPCSVSIPKTICCGWCHINMVKRLPDDGTLNGTVIDWVFHCDFCGHKTDLSYYKPKTLSEPEGVNK